MAVVMLYERGVSFKITLPYPVDHTINEPPEKPLDIPIDYKAAMQKLAELSKKLPIQGVRVSPTRIELTLIVRSFEEMSAPEQLFDIDRVLVENGFASRSKWL